MQVEQGIIFAVLVHAASTIWWASKMNTTANFMRNDMNRIAGELRDWKNSFEVQIQAMWRRIDELKDRLN